MTQRTLAKTIDSIIKVAHKVPLLKDRLDKPLDTGNGLLTASIGAAGVIVSIGGYHSRWGYIVCHQHGQFPVSGYGSPQYVRQYRQQLASTDQSGIGFRMPAPACCIGYHWLGPSLSLAQASNCGLEFAAMTFFDTENPRLLWHLMLVTNLLDERRQVPVEWAATASLNRASYAQLTEGGPIAPPVCLNTLCCMGDEMVLSNPNLEAQLRIEIHVDEAVAKLTEASDAAQSSSEPVRFGRRYVAGLEPGDTTCLIASMQLLEGSDPISEPVSVDTLTPSLMKHLFDQKDWPDSLEAYVINRNLSYIVSCCAVPVSDSVCLLTDHQLLPLSWNRDAYYMARFVMAYCETKAGSISAEDCHRLQSMVRRHLMWMFCRAERYKGFWGRSYLANGQLKDPAFQLDQQLYPILELCDYCTICHDYELLETLLPDVTDLVGRLLDLADAGSLLLPTEETPADDQVAYPYHFSSQVLWWRALESLAAITRSHESASLRCPSTVEGLKAVKGLSEPRGLGSGKGVDALAQKVRQSVLDRMMVSVDGKEMFCYSSDLKGNCQLYHDANDLPTVYAPEWGFCSVRDHCWLNTIEFAFSSANRLGVFPGKYGGLGSIHTPAPWPLGNVQRLAFHRILGDTAGVAQEVGRLLDLTQADGLLPEAVDPDTGSVVSRHWFAWPGAAFGFELLQCRKHHMQKC